MQLEHGCVVFAAESLFLLLEDAEDHPVDDQPAVLPEEREEPLNLVERDHLREQRHYPILAQNEHFDLSVGEMRG